MSRFTMLLIILL